MSIEGKAIAKNKLLRFHMEGGAKQHLTKSGHVEKTIKRSKSVRHNFEHFLSTSDFQSEVGEVFGEIGGELPAKFGIIFSSFLCW